jgi:hypothetical protein
MKNCYLIATALGLTLLASAACPAADFYVADMGSGYIQAFDDTVGTIVNPDSLYYEVLGLARDAQGRLLVAGDEGDGALMRFDIDTQTWETLEPYDTGHYVPGVCPDLGSDIYIIKSTPMKREDGSGGRQSHPWLGILYDGAGPADTVHVFGDSLELIDVCVRPLGGAAGDIIVLAHDFIHNEDRLMEFERLGPTSFSYVGDVVDPSMLYSASNTAVAFGPTGTLYVLDYYTGVIEIDEIGEYVFPVGGGYTGDYGNDFDIDENGIFYIASSYWGNVRRYDHHGTFIPPAIDMSVAELMSPRAIVATAFTPTPEGENSFTEPTEGVEVTYEEVTSSGYTTAETEVTTSRMSPEGNYLPACAQLPGSRATEFTYISLTTDAVYKSLIQVDVLEEGSRLFYADGVGDTFRDFTVTGSIEDARGTIPRFSEMPTGSKGRAATDPTEVVLVEDNRQLSEVVLYKFWRLEEAMDVPPETPGSDPCPWEFIEWLQKYVDSARDYYDDEKISDALSELSIMNGMIRSHAGWCIPDSSDDPNGNVVGKILAHSKTLMFSLAMKEAEDSTGSDDAASAVSLAVASPASGQCVLTLTGPVGAEVSARIYSVSGRLVATVYDGRLTDSVETVVWNGLDSHGRRAASGVYFARAESSSGVLTSKVVFVR